MIGSLSTPTLMKLAGVSENWEEQKEILGLLRDRSDLFNLEPVLRIAFNPSFHFTVRRAAIECAAAHNPDLTLARTIQTAENRSLGADQREAALFNLAALQNPFRTLPVLENVAGQHGPTQLRCAAIKLVGKFRNVRSATLLKSLTRDRDYGVAQQACQALGELIEANGGLHQVVQKLTERADYLVRNRKMAAAREALQAAVELDPRNGQTLYKLARLAVA